MCGIVGIVRKDAKHMDDLHCVRRLDRIVHRGPDDEGVHQSGALSFGMRRLSIIDLAGGHQPIANEDEASGSFVTVRSTTFVAFGANSRPEDPSFDTVRY